MATAKLIGISGTFTGPFGIALNFDDAILVSSLQKTDINLSAGEGNGVTGVDFEIMSVAGATTEFYLAFMPPANAQGSFDVAFDAAARVTPQSSNTPEAVMSNTIRVSYDTRTARDGAFGTPVVTAEQITVPLTFNEAVDFREFRVSGFDYQDLIFRPRRPKNSLVGARKVVGNLAGGIEVSLEVPERPQQNHSVVILLKGRHTGSGAMLLEFTGKVNFLSAGEYRRPLINPIIILHTNPNPVPKVKYWVGKYIYVPGSRYDIQFGFESEVRGFDSLNISENFTIDGLGTVSLWRWAGSTPPDRETPEGDTLNTNWVSVSASDAGQYFLIRVPSMPNSGTIKLDRTSLQIVV